MAVLYEYNTTASNNRAGTLYGSNKEGQTFTIGTVGDNVNQVISYVKFKMWRVGSPGNIVCELFATSENTPTGSALSSGTFDGDTLDTSSTGEVISITMSAYEMQASTKYAIALSCPDGNYANYGCYKFNYTGNPYSGGVWITYNGSTWAVADSGTSDAYFEIYSDLPLSEIEGTTGGSSSVSAGINATGELNSTINTSSSTSASAEGKGDLAATINSSSSATGDITAVFEIGGIVNCSSTVAGALEGTGLISGTINGKSTAVLVLTNDLVFGLLGYWKLDETSGIIAKDSVGSNDGLPAVGVMPGFAGVSNSYSYYFNGWPGAVLDINTNYYLDTTDFTISLWYKGVNDGGLFGSVHLATGFGCYIDGGYVKFSVAGTVVTGDTYAVTDNNWHHIVCTRQGDVGKIYIDGELDKQGTVSAGSVNSISDIVIGNFGDNMPTFEITGNIDEVGIWNKVLTEEDITYLYNNGNGFPYPFITAFRAKNLKFYITESGVWDDTDIWDDTDTWID